MEKRVRMELKECAQALLELNSESSLELIETVISDARFHLEGLKSVPTCNTSQVYALTQRLMRAEDLHDKKKRVA